MLQRVIFDINTINQHFTFIRIIQSWDHLHQRGLAASCRTNDTKDLTAVYFKIDMGKNRLLVFLIITERNVLKLYSSFLYLLILPGAVILCRDARALELCRSTMASIISDINICTI